MNSKYLMVWSHTFKLQPEPKNEKWCQGLCDRSTSRLVKTLDVKLWLYDDQVHLTLLCSAISCQVWDDPILFSHGLMTFSLVLGFLSWLLYWCETLPFQFFLFFFFWVIGFLVGYSANQSSNQCRAVIRNSNRHPGVTRVILEAHNCDFLRIKEPVHNHGSQNKLEMSNDKWPPVKLSVIYRFFDGTIRSLLFLK
jgi:hypothetical protein